MATGRSRLPNKNSQAPSAGTLIDLDGAHASHPHARGFGIALNITARLS
jgi:hypothetical protein